MKKLLYFLALLSAISFTNCSPDPDPPAPNGGGTSTGGGSTTATCSDGIKNGDETGVDCGGSCDPCSFCNEITYTWNDGTSVNTYNSQSFEYPCGFRIGLNYTDYQWSNNRIEFQILLSDDAWHINSMDLNNTSGNINCFISPEDTTYINGIVSDYEPTDIDMFWCLDGVKDNQGISWGMVKDNPPICAPYFHRFTNIEIVNETYDEYKWEISGEFSTQVQNPSTLQIRDISGSYKVYKSTNKLIQPPGNPASINTFPAVNVQDYLAEVGGEITDEGGSPVISRGICYGLWSQPTIDYNDYIVDANTGTGNFQLIIEPLEVNKTYYARAYAINNAGVSYGNEITFTTIPISNAGQGVVFDGFNYSTIVVGNGQEWFAENLRTTTYSNGDPIPYDSVGFSSDQIGNWTYGWYDSVDYDYYGKNYNWYTVSDPRNVCPTGWHVPSLSDWDLLIGYLDPNFYPTNAGIVSNIAGGILKSTGTQHWYPPNYGATNSIGFNALPGGLTSSSNLDGENGFFWSSSINPSTGMPLTNYAYYGNSKFMRFNYGKDDHHSIRCIKD
ncbi:hypothetical protein FRY74_00140 [Vicingus serpentipes]|uniref:Fibrobacter succinogenes major paralogous domain-containing protein n=1 Tax=Vicingus serpentipes TaxID=1926625 RepID=A0A5C6RWC4_9FLAO|nr:fibrobacter succinogenes major paralogous domain-containing protein [Vicingus serpentipes]TXB66628.1 hypothetical protein FRY74_00140 [Vicingus serpentipes]